MFKLLQFSTFLFLSIPTWATTTDELIKKGQQEEKKLNETTALKLYLASIKQNPDNTNALSSAAMMYSNIGSRSKADLKEKYYNKARELAQKALKLNPKSARTNFVMAVISGRDVYMTSLPKAKIRRSAAMKKYAEKAVKINPKYKDAWALLGLWYYERSTLTKIEKKFVKLLGGLPHGSLQQAEHCISKCIQLDSKHVLGLLTKARVQLAKGNKKMARAYLLKVTKAPVKHVADIKYKRKAKQYLQKL